jgi:hypothetical protein
MSQEFTQNADVTTGTRRTSETAEPTAYWHQLPFDACPTAGRVDWIWLLVFDATCPT